MRPKRSVRDKLPAPLTPWEKYCYALFKDHELHEPHEPREPHTPESKSKSKNRNANKKDKK